MSFAESFIRGHARGSQSARDTERQRLDQEKFEEQKKENKERADEHKQQLELDKAIATLNYQFKLSDLQKTTKRPTTTAKEAGFLEQGAGPGGEEMGGPRAEDIGVGKNVPPTLFDMSALGGGKVEVPAMFAEDVAAQKLQAGVAEKKAESAVEVDAYGKKKAIDEQHEGFVLGRDMPQFGYKKGDRVNPAELSARASMYAADQATVRKELDGRQFDGPQTEYAADQVLQRRLDYRSLSKEQKPAVLAALAKRGLDIPRPLSAKEREAGNNALSGLAALDHMDALLDENPMLAAADSANLPGFLGAPARVAVDHLSEFSAAKREAVDVVTRLRTGAALNKQEEGFYPRQVVEAFDDKATRMKKHNNLRAFYLGMTGIPVKLISPDGAKSKTAQDMFDPKQRLGVRKLIDQGWRLEY